MCLLDLKGTWTTTGTLDGTMTTEYDILNHGPCVEDMVIGMYDETWIVTTVFDGTVGGSEGTFETIATVELVDEHITGQMTIVPDSGTGELTGLRGIINLDEMLSDEAPWPLTGYYYYDLPSGAPVAEAAIQSGLVEGNVDFAVPDWGLAEGWVHFDVESLDPEQETAQGIVRWVEYNDAGELRYVVGRPACMAFGLDGHTAMIAVEIDHRYGWGEGDSGQWMQFWVNDAGPDGKVVFASPLFPPAEENPGCAVGTPDFQIEAIASDLEVQAP